MRGQNGKARETLKVLRGSDDVDREIAIIVSASQNEILTKEGGVMKNWSNPKVCAHLLTHLSFDCVLADSNCLLAARTQVRYGLLLGIGLHLAQQLSGINAVFYYSTSFFASLGLEDPLLATTLVGAVNVVATVAAIFLMDAYGRRPLLLWSVGGMFVSTLGIMWTMFILSGSGDGLNVDFWNIMSLIFTMAFVSFFEIGLGPVAWLLVAELFTARLRSDAMGIATLFNWTSNTIVGLAYPLMAHALGNYSWLPFACVLFCTYVGTYFFLIETQDKTIEEIQLDIAARVAEKTDYQDLARDLSLTYRRYVDKLQRNAHHRRFLRLSFRGSDISYSNSLYGSMEVNIVGSELR